MKFYYIKSDLKRYRPLAHILSEYLGKTIRYVDEDSLNTSYHDVIYYDFLNQQVSGPGILMGINYDMWNKWDSKKFQYDQFSNKVRMPDTLIYENSLKLIADFNIVKKLFGKFIVFDDRSAGGLNCVVCDENTDTKEVYSDIREPLKVVKFLEDVHNISLHFIIAGSSDIWLSPIVDQIIKNDVLFKGATYPSIIQNGVKSKVYRTAYEVAYHLARNGYKGLGHIDLMVHDNEVYFTELNPRKAATTMCMSYMMERCFNYSIPIIEYHAIKDRGIVNLCRTREDIPWTIEYISYVEKPQNEPGDERRLFTHKMRSTVIYNERYKDYSFKVCVG